MWHNNLISTIHCPPLIILSPSYIRPQCSRGNFHTLQNRNSKPASILQTGHITLSSAQDQQLENHRYVHLHFKCMHLSITSTFIELHPTTGVPDPTDRNRQALHYKKHNKNTHIRSPRQSTHLTTNLDNTRHLILRKQIPRNLRITIYIFTARNTTGSNHCIILLSSWRWA